MSKDLSKAKRPPGSHFPEATYDAAGGVRRVEEMLTPSKLKSRFLFGIPLVSPITKEKFTDEMIKDAIERSVVQFELDSALDVHPTLKRVRLPFDPALYQSNIWLECAFKPVQKVLRVAICSASYANSNSEADPNLVDNENQQYPAGGEIFRVPPEWIDMSYAKQGKIFVSPITPATAAVSTGTAVASSGAYALAFIGQGMWIPAFWTIEALVGLATEQGQVPSIVNECIGAKAAYFILQNLFPLYRTTSQSLGIDGMSQSVSDQLQQLMQAKMQQLEEQYKESVSKLKTQYGQKLFATNV